MREIKEIIQTIGMPEDTAEYCEKCFAMIAENPQLSSLLQTAEKQYMTAFAPEKTVGQIATESGLHRYTVNLLVLLRLAIRLRQIYKIKGFSEENFRDFMVNLRCKIAECRQVYGIFGSFVFVEFKRYFECTAFTLGRLSFEARSVPFDYRDVCKKGETVLGCHIPSSGPLRAADVEASFRQAYEFYGIQGKMVVTCSSWLLYPPFYREVFPENSNLRRFYELFDVVEQHESSSGDISWRVFGTMESDLNKLPLETTLQRNMHAFLKKGNRMGSGYGILVRDYTEE